MCHNATYTRQCSGCPVANVGASRERMLNDPKTSAYCRSEKLNI